MISQGTRKVTPEIERKIVELIGKGIVYNDIRDVVRNKFGVKIGVMTISNIKKKHTKITSLENEEDINYDVKRQRVSNSMDIALELCENHLKRLQKREKDFDGLTHQDIRLLNDMIDKLVKVRKVLTTEIVMSKELMFPAESLRAKYQLKKRE